MLPICAGGIVRSVEINSAERGIKSGSVVLLTLIGDSKSSVLAGERTINISSVLHLF
jgi:hypothetical protein